MLFSLNRAGDDILEDFKKAKEEESLKEITELAKAVKDLR